MMKYEVTVNEEDSFAIQERAYYEKMNPGYTVTGATLHESFPDGSGCTNIIFKGKYTRYGMVRDCGDHYIIARYSRYDRIDKGTLKLTKDVEDR